MENRGTIDAPDVHFSIRSGEPSASAGSRLEETLGRVLGLNVDPEPLQHLAEGEPALRPTALALRGMRPPRFADWFEAVANVLPFQQLSLAAGVAIVGRLVERFGTHLEHVGRRFDAFPTADVIAGTRLASLRACGLSARKAESLRYIARAIELGQLREEQLAGMSTHDAFRALTELPDIGPWSAGLKLLRGLGRLDVFPAGDVGSARRLRELLRLRSEASLRRVVERFGDQRGYFYCALDGSLLARALIHPAPRAPAAGRERAERPVPHSLARER